ncbi:MAG: histidine--tRNA ligase [Verrucomicrobiales bacterium]
MASSAFASLPGFRDLPPRECAARNHVFAAWREAARRAGFVEWEGPTLESTELYRKKSGDEIVGQLFHFVDKGEREVALRPELTPTLARVAAARHRDFKKPMKWFQIGSCYRYEAPQKGRLREFYQWNLDILGDDSPAADAELIAVGIDALRLLGFTADDFAVRLSDRRFWDGFLREAGIEPGRTTSFLQVIDKWEREKPEEVDRQLRALGTTREAVAEFMTAAGATSGSLGSVLADLSARGLGGFVRVDPGIVRGLAYYTGTVFEFFSLRSGARAIAGGGRYDQLVGTLSDGVVAMPAAGLGMGDVVLGNLIDETPEPSARREKAWVDATSVDVWVIVADESRRPEALALVQELRKDGFKVDFSLGSAKVGRQFQSAEAAGARAGLVVGAEWPVLKLKDLARREEVEAEVAGVASALRALWDSRPD